MILTLPALARPLLEPHLPADAEARWFASAEDACQMAPGAEVGWLDMYEARDMVAALERADALKWLNTIYAGIDWMPKDTLARQGVTVTNGAGINAITIAEYVVMGMLTIAKGYREVVRAQDRHEWLRSPPGRLELAETSALILGGGAIGSLVRTRLAAFDVAVTTVRRRPGPGELGTDAWRARLGEFDWVILAAPATAETQGMIGAAELDAMKPDAVLINIARGSVVDQEALVTALTENRIGGAFLDVTTPEPLPSDHPLWTLPNAHVTMHLSGQSQSKMFQRGARLFLDNLARYRSGEPLINAVDLDLGY
ncbi:putative oxidoreductase [Sphingomonas changbaiensis NBRC 104936]|uniref:Putative oxidoreductase n=1 Tax=Sphingomonas changbaiensis NBRC 104936 TaxID=1219043 RepID=A0A0E9MLL0_9SPHN|nr:D-2-hydroxyacid dehydrogenase [Sphingomonas changbaiensis]GAO38015.1 putative oxidoreductase [Sphingomonas changbaiensis NBRC 104936]